ncbi:MAG: amino acid ABC transporter ATP-binding protein [Anaerolineae bacterium]|jgi:ABC-type polar amino acid transport system ATPase subunit
MTQEILQLVDINKSFGDNHVLRGIDLTVARQEVVVIIGPSGQGKSTLLRCVNLLEWPDSGQVVFEGKNYAAQHSFSDRLLGKGREDLRYLRTHIGMVFQHFNLFPHLTALQNCTLGLEQALKISKSEGEKRAKEQLNRVGLHDKYHAYPDTLSGGQKQRVALARSLVMEPKIMLFDEVTSALDPELIGGILAEMKRLAEEGMTMIVVTHEMGFAREVGSRLVFLSEGQVIEQGPCEEILSNPQEMRTKQFLSAILEH